MIEVYFATPVDNHACVSCSGLVVISCLYPQLTYTRQDLRRTQLQPHTRAARRFHDRSEVGLNGWFFLRAFRAAAWGSGRGEVEGPGGHFVRRAGTGPRPRHGNL